MKKWGYILHLKVPHPSSLAEAQPASSKDHDTGFGDSRDALAQL